MKQEQQIFGHPKGLFYLFFAELWERFSYYGMRALLTLYMVNEFFLYITDEVAREEMSIGIFAAYGSLVYATPVIGGMIADKFIGFKKSIMLGGILMALGHFFMAFYFDAEDFTNGLFGFPINNINGFFFYSALALLIVGNGFFKPNISTMVGRLYNEGDTRRDSGFTIFYMGINIGAFLAPLACGYLGMSENWGWHYGFGAAGIGMLIGLIFFWRGIEDGVFNDNGNQPEEYKEKKMYGLRTDYFFYLIAILLVPISAFLVRYNAFEVIGELHLHSSILIALLVIILAIIAKNMISLTKIDNLRLLTVLVLTLFITVFWSFFELAGTAITLFAERNVNLVLLNASQTNAINPGYIMFLAIPFSLMWVGLAKAQKNPITPIKFALGILQLGLGFLVFAMSAQYMDAAGKTPFIFLMVGYFLMTTGELFISPIGLSKVTELSPKKMTAFMMGVYFLSSSFAHYISKFIANATITGSDEVPEPGFMTTMIENVTGFAGATTDSTIEGVQSLLNYTSVFTQVGVVAIGMAIIAFIITPVLKKWMHGVH
ncbi:MAG: MFS transporter [Flavobacteriales bacterium]|nr:MFS transporter [Flavobacteriales bacterium]|tara:strand:- start:339 stop:1973 length:1635 start_codon:yes stop_codon:yes gene_type:complete